MNQYTHIRRTEEKEGNFVYQCRSRNSRNWVNVTYQWLVDNLKYNEKEFYKDLTDPDQPSNQMLELPVGKACAHLSIRFLKSAPPVKYQQGNDPTCCFSSLASALDAIGDVVAASVISSAITLSTKVTGVDATSQVHAYKSRIDYARCLMANQVKIPGGQKCCYQSMPYKPGKTYDILNDISQFPTLVQLMDLRGNMQHCVTVAGKWIFNSNFPKAIPLTAKSLNDCCSEMEEKDDGNGFDYVHRAIRFVPTKANGTKFVNFM